MRKGDQPSPGFAGSRWVRYQATFDGGRVREATNGEWVGAPGRNVEQFACPGHDTPRTQRTDTKLFYVSLSFAFVPLSERNSQRGAHERHKAGEKRVGVRRRAGRWV